MTEIVNSFKDVAKERIKNPFIGSFIFAWIIFNWKPIIYLFLSEDTIESRIQIITQHFSSVWSTLVFPLAFALIYIIVLPYFMWLFEELYTRAVRERLDNKQKSDLDKIERNLEIAKRSLVLENVKADYKETLELNKQIEALKIEIENKDDIINNLFSKQKASQDEIEKAQDRILQLGEDVISYEERREFDNDYELFKKSQIYDYFKIIGYSAVLDERVSAKKIGIEVAEKFQFENIVIRNLNAGYYRFNFTKKGKYFWDKYITELMTKDSSNVLKED